MNLLIGTYTSDGGSRGIYAADWDGDAGALGSPRLLAEIENPSFLAIHPSRPLLYAASETARFQSADSGAVAVIRLDATEPVTESMRPSGGTSPCHLAVDPQGGFLVASNYSSGTAAVVPLADGLPGDPAVLQLFGRGPDQGRQAGPHAHSAFFDPTGERFYVQDLGSDRIWGFILDRAARAVRPLDPPFLQLAAGSGPRHLAFHPLGPWAYVINELDNTVTALAWARKTGALAPFQTVNSLPGDAPALVPSYCADIHVSSDGAYLYGSNRGHDSLVVWRIDPEKGGLVLVQHVPCGGDHPRSFALSPDERWLLCANMNADNIVIFRRDFRTGVLTRTTSVSAPCPVCLLFRMPGF
jgi:6-phosphogluconolactonase